MGLQMWRATPALTIMAKASLTLQVHGQVAAPAATGNGLISDIAHRLVMIAYCTVVTAIFIHDLSDMTMMKLYQRSRGAKSNQGSGVFGAIVKKY